MTENEQIQEMENILLEIEEGFIDYCDKPCAECGHNKFLHCVSRYKAERLYSKDYRKVERGEWIVTDADSGSFGEYAPFIEFKCPKCESVYGIESGQYGWVYGDPIPWVSCPLCGADMRGEKE